MYEDGTNVPVGTEFIEVVPQTSDWYRPGESNAPSKWEERWATLRTRFERIVDKCRPLECLLVQDRVPAHAPESVDVKPLLRGCEIIQSDAGLSREDSQLRTRDGHALFGAFPIRESDGTPICNSAGDPFAFRFGLTRQSFVYTRPTDARESRPLPVPRLMELARDGTGLLYQLPANVALSVWRNWRSGWSRGQNSSECLWLDALFELSWQRQPGDALHTKRSAWLKNTSVQLLGDGLFPRLNDQPHLAHLKSIPQENGHPVAYYSKLPDVARASVAAIDEVLERGTTTMGTQEKRFKIALSFPAEHRPFVEQVAQSLASQVGRDRVLYDKYYEAEFARLDLDVYLPRLYREQSELIVIFLCPEYAKKRWCRLEWRHIRQLIATVESERIMLVSFGSPGDLSELGILPGDGYIDIGERPASEIADLILDRSRGSNAAGIAPSPPPPVAPQPLAPSPAGSSALKVWQERLAYLLEQEAIVSDPAQRFSVRKLIEEAKDRIRELGGQP